MRKKSDGVKIVPITIELYESTYLEIELQRGLIPRSTFLREKLKEVFKK